MAKHQIIYTSCKKGIEGVNDGQQVFSYDEGFENYKNIGVTSLFGYVVPLKSGESMTEELALTMPQAFSYRSLKNGIAAIALNTYLGRDYMGSAGRFGNTLSHVITFDEKELDCYPCTLYQGPSLRSSMEYEEVNSDVKPELLPAPEFISGDLINPDNISEFLEEDRMPYLRQMVAAILKFSSEKKRIIICDEQDNIVQWFAAVHYAFPIEIARKIWFSSYVNDPELADTPLCGVVSQGSKYNVSQYSNNKRFYLFDFVNDVVAPEEEQDDFLNFLDGTFSFCYSRLEEFKDFVSQKTTFREVNEEYYNAYRLFCFATDGVSKTDYENFQRAEAFSEQYATQECKIEIVRKLLNDPETFDIVGKDYKYMFALLTYMLRMYSVVGRSTQNEIKECLINRLLYTLSDQNVDETQFSSLYNQLKKFALSIGLSIPTELMEENNKKALFALMEKGVATWKIVFVLRTITDYVIDQKIPYQKIVKNEPVGSLQYGIIRALTNDADVDTLDEIIPVLLGLYKGHPQHLFYFTLMIEDAMQGNVQATFQEFNELVWKHFAVETLEMDFDSVKKINEELNQKERTDELFTIYQVRMKNQTKFENSQTIYEEMYDYISKQILKSIPDYKEMVIEELILSYLNLQKKMDDKQRRDNGLKLLTVITPLKYFTEDTRKMCSILEPYYSYMEQDKEQEEVIEQLTDYFTACGQLIDGKLELAVIEKSLAGVTQIQEAGKALNFLKKAVRMHSADVMCIKELSDRENYYSNLYLGLLNCEIGVNDFARIHDLFLLEGEGAVEYYAYTAKIVVKKSRKDNDYLVEFILSMLNVDDINILKEVGSCLCKIGDKRLDDINSKLNKRLKNDKAELKKWNIIYKKAEETNPLLKGITDLFNRNK